MRNFNKRRAHRSRKATRWASLKLLVLEDRSVPSSIVHGPVERGAVFDSAMATVSGGNACIVQAPVANGVGAVISTTFGPAVGVPPTFTGPNSTTFTNTKSNSFQFTAGGDPSTTFSTQAWLDSPPAGVVLSSSGLLTGYPTAGPGTYSFNVFANNSAGSKREVFYLYAVAAPMFVNGPPQTSVFLGANYYFQFSATGYPAPTFSVSGLAGSGITMNPTTGVLTGVPTVAASYDVTVTAQCGPNSVQEQFTITAGPGAAAWLAITGPQSVLVGRAATYSIVAHDFPGYVATSYTGPVTFTTTDPAAHPSQPFGLTNGSGSNTVTFNSAGIFDLTATGPDPRGGTFSVTLKNIRVTLTTPRLSVRR
jgi:hypothetical protein